MTIENGWPLSNHELLSGVVGEHRAAHLLAKHGDIRAVLDEGSDKRLKNVLQIAARYHETKLLNRRDKIGGTDDAAKFLQCRYAGLDREILGGLYLNARNCVLDFDWISTGGVCGAHVHPREIIKECMRRNAAALILCHNHPSGDPEPSEPDVAMTEKLQRILADVDVNLLDHFIVGDSAIVSMASRGLM